MGTALVKDCNDLPINSEIGSLTVVILLDMSVAFNCANHEILLNSLNVLCWTLIFFNIHFSPIQLNLLLSLEVLSVDDGQMTY